jgi:hypothetical protein
MAGHRGDAEIRTTRKAPKTCAIPDVRVQGAGAARNHLRPYDDGTDVAPLNDDDVLAACTCWYM